MKTLIYCLIIIVLVAYKLTWAWTPLWVDLSVGAIGLVFLLYAKRSDDPGAKRGSNKQSD